MKITVNKDIQPKVNAILSGIVSMNAYSYSGYDMDSQTLIAPSSDLNLEAAINIARLGAVVDVFEMWYEVPDANINDDVPAGVSFETYLDEFEVEQTRTWAELGLNAQGDTNSLRFWQASNNGVFQWEDAEIIKEAGFVVLDHKGLSIRLNDDEYADTGDPEYAVLETIPYVDQNWRYGYFDMIHAHIRIGEIYEAKGIDDNARWAASTDEEKEILVRWNIVGLNRAGTLVDPGWSEGRQLKEIGRKYREFNLNMIIATEKRFNDWYQYLNMVFANSGKVKFLVDWEWNFKNEYVSRYLRQFELGATNALVNFNNVTLGAYVDADFVTSTITAAQIVANLDKVLTDKEYYI